MENKSSVSNQVLINGLPEGYGLRRTRDLALNCLDSEDAVIDIDFKVNFDGTKQSDSAIVSLRNKADVNALIEKAVIVATFGGQQHNLKITQTRQKTKVLKPVVVFDTNDEEGVDKNSRKKNLGIENPPIDESTCGNNSLFIENNEEKGVESVSNVASRKSPKTLRTFEYFPDVKSEVIEFIRRSPKHMESLSKEFEGLSIVKFEEHRFSGKEPAQFVVRFLLPRKSEVIGQQTHHQSGFESECTSKMMIFLQNFTFQSGHFKFKDMDEIRKMNLWRNCNCDVIKIEIDHNVDVSVLARWNHPKDGDFVIAGLKNEVSQAFKWLQSKMEKEKKTEMSEFVKEWQLEFLKDCGILDEMKNKFENLVIISIDDEDCKLTFYGLKHDVENCKVELIRQLKKINSTRLTFLEDDKIGFLTHSKGRKNPEFDVVQFIKSRFRQNNLKCVLQCSSEPKLRYSLQSDLDGGKVILDEIIQCRNISLDAGLVQLLDTEEWKKFEKNLCLSKTLTLKINMKNSSIILIGVAKCLTEGEILLNEFVKKNIVQHKMIEMSYPVLRFLSEYPNEVELEEKLKNIEWHPTSDGAGGIMLHGKAEHITTALTNVEELISSIKTEERDVSEPGIPGYFRDSPGRQFLKTTQSITKCIIFVDKANNNDLKLKNANPKSILQQHLLAAATCSGRLLKNLALKLFSIFLWLLSIFILTIFERILKVLTFLRQARFYHTVYVQVKKGDILTSSCDVIVNLTGSKFDLTRGELSAKLVAKAGTGIVQECSTNPQYSSTHYRVTSGGGLNCKNVLHLVSPKDAKYVSKSLKTAFEVVEKKLKLSSVAVPAIGTGNLRLLPVDIAKATQDALDTFAKTKPSFLRRIDIVIFQASMLQDFQKIILAGSNNDHNINKNPFTKKHESIIPKEGFGEKKDSVKLSLCAANQINIINAWQRIREHVHQKSASREITDETVPYLDEEAEKKLIALETNLSVKLRKSTDILGKQKITLLGIKDNVMEAYSAASEVVQEYKQIVTCAEYVIWQYHDRKSNTWKNLPRRENWKTENAYKKNEKGSVRLSVKVGSTKQVCVLDFSKMEATCLGFSEQIYRNLRSTTDLPTSWSDMNGFQWLLENVPQNSKEHQNVLSQFSSGGLNISQAFVQRVQNPTLYKQFIAQKGKVEARMKAAGITNIPVTQQLFHGTSADVCQKVYKDGFDRSYAGKNATMYGRGVYFAKTAQYSNGYATPDANGQRRMFLAEVVTGEYCKGNQSVITPPMKPNQTDLYDSVVDNPSSPSIFVVFKDASVYPLYVLTY